MSKEIKMLIATSKTKKAIESLMELVLKTGDSDLENKLIMQSGRLSNLIENEDSGMWTQGQANAERNKINRVLLSIVKEVEDLSPEPVTKPEQLSNSGLKAVDIIDMEMSQLIERLQKLMEKRKFLQDHYDITADADQKFSYKKKIDQLNEEIDLIKSKLS